MFIHRIQYFLHTCTVEPQWLEPDGLFTLPDLVSVIPYMGLLWSNFRIYVSLLLFFSGFFSECLNQQSSDRAGSCTNMYSRTSMAQTPLEP